MRTPYVPRPGLGRKENEPDTPQGLDLRELPRGVRAELRSLTPELAEIVGAHLLMAGQLIDSDPALAYAHAEAARRRASRLAVTREATGEAAYAAGDYAVALQEFRALRRMNGGTEFLAAIADCERALGQPDRALKVIREGLSARMDLSQRVELRLVEAGVRLDQGRQAEALRVLKSEIQATAGRGARPPRARLRYGYADLLEQTGDLEAAERWFAAAAALDTEGETDAADRVARLQGLVLEIDEDALIGDTEGADAASAEPGSDEAASATTSGDPDPDSAPAEWGSSPQDDDPAGAEEQE
ncbi:MAG: tetratricopeptide repeat protein [Propioniciclava sp.]